MKDVIIIGGGVVGAAIARDLSAYQLRVALLEKEAELAFGVSKSNSGIIHPGTQNPAGSLKGRLCVQGNTLTRRIAKELGVDFKEVGELIVAFNQKDVARLLALKKEAELLGVPRLEIVGRNWLNRNEPNLSPKVVAALYAPTAGIISPYRLTYDLAENAMLNKVQINTDTEVRQIELCPAGKSSAKPYFKVQTSQKVYKTRFIVNAAGLHADAVCRMVGVDDFNIVPYKGEEFILDRKKEYLANHLLFPLPTKTSKGILIIKTADGNPMIGPTAEPREDKEDLSTSKQGFQKVLSSAQRMLPAINGQDIIAYFAGLRPKAGDDFIIRHEDAVPGFITVAGIQSPGLTAAPAIAVMVRGLLRKNGLVLTRKKVFHKYREKTTHLFEIPLSKTKQMIKKDKKYGEIVCRCEMVSVKEIEDAIRRGARTLDGIKFRTRAQAGRCHGGFCTTRIMKILSRMTKTPITKITKHGRGSEMIKGQRT